MTIKTLAIGITMALILTATNSTANAKTDLSKEFCGDRYCGYSNSGDVVEKKVVRTAKVHRKIKTHKEKKEKRIRIASLGNSFTSESPSLLSKAAGYIGSNPTGWKSLWCARFICVIAPSACERLKRMGLNPNWARDYAKLPGAKQTGRPGDLVILSRGSAGHIGVLKAFDKRGNPIIVSGNSRGHTVSVGVYSKRRVIAYASI